MKIKIKAKNIGRCLWLGEADPSFNFDVGFPGTVAYGDNRKQALERIHRKLTERGYDVVNPPEGGDNGTMSR